MVIEDEYSGSEFEESDTEELENKPTKIAPTSIKIQDDVDVDIDDDDDIDDLEDDDDLDDDDELENKFIDDGTDTGNINDAPIQIKDSIKSFDLSDDDDEDSDDENYLQKLDENVETNILQSYYPELNYHNYDEVNTLANVVRNSEGTIIDPLHKTLPFITRYEKARIIGERAKQLNSGAAPMVHTEPSVIDGYLIALKEFEEKKIPYIIKRPLPNGGCEYWKLSDLEILV